MSKKTKAWLSKSFKVESKQETKGVQERSWATKFPDGVIAVLSNNQFKEIGNKKFIKGTRVLDLAAR